MSMPSGRSGQRPEGEAEGEADARERERRLQAQQEERPRMNLQQIHSWVDLEIEQALRRGEFDNLPGAGKPLRNLEQNDPDWWVKGLIEREQLDLSSALPTVMALRQERRGFPESLAGIADEVAVRERLEDYNARVLEDRRKPAVGPKSPAVAGRVDVDDVVAQWRQLRADRARPLTEDRVEDEPATVDGPLGRTERVARGSLVVMLVAGAIVLLLVGMVWVLL